MSRALSVSVLFERRPASCERPSARMLLRLAQFRGRVAPVPLAQTPRAGPNLSARAGRLVAKAILANPGVPIPTVKVQHLE